jgi:hypothetical protein
MKALSIRQPWASLILHGGKDIENRTWTTRQRGTILIHASKAMTRAEYEGAITFSAPMLYAMHDIDDAEFEKKFGFDAQQRGGIVGMADIVDCVPSSASPWYMGAIGFVLANPRPLPFTPYKGALGFFEVPDALVAGLNNHRTTP